MLDFTVYLLFLLLAGYVHNVCDYEISVRSMNLGLPATDQRPTTVLKWP